MRTIEKHKVKEVNRFKDQLLSWAQQFEDLVWLDSNDYQHSYSKYDAVLAVDAFTGIQTDYDQAFEKLSDYQTRVKDWIFGYLSYDLKNDTEPLSSKNHDGLGFHDLYFFQPKKLFLLKGDSVEIQYLNYVSDELEADLTAIYKEAIAVCKYKNGAVKMKHRIDKADYSKSVNTLKTHIQRGNIYEANFCYEFYAENSTINPLQTYRKLNQISRPPFASFLKSQDKYVLCASPERYLKKAHNTVISQPIKGTSKRSNNTEEDKRLKLELCNDVKERSENIMIVDLVRNDLSKTAIQGSVNTEELCKVYKFNQVHQMISTITSKVEKLVNPVEIIKTTFPMGSMTGAPKISAMKIIENLETSKRGVYSGAIGYFSPENDFDFNVVIRSILYNQTEQYVSFSVGSAITAKSDPEKEYEECLVKAKAMLEVLEG